MDAKGAFVGRGTANPHSLIGVRLFANAHDDLDAPGFWVGRLREAAQVRAITCPGRRDLRLMFPAGDRLPRGVDEI